MNRETEAIGGIDEQKFDDLRFRRIFDAYRQDVERELSHKPLIGVPREASPEQLMRLGRTNTTVSSLLGIWRAGSMPLENCLILCINELVKQNDHILKQLLHLSSFSRPDVSVHERPADAPTVVQSNTQV